MAIEDNFIRVLGMSTAARTRRTCAAQACTVTPEECEYAQILRNACSARVEFVGWVRETEQVGYYTVSSGRDTDTSTSS